MKLSFTILFLIITNSIYSQQSKPSILGNVDFYVLLKSAPVLQSTPEAAFEYACNKDINCQGESQLETQYENFKKKMEMYSNQLASSLESKAQDFYGKKGREGLYNDPKKQVNQNELIQQMGGVDKISQMSEKEREKAAKKALAKNTSASTFSPFSEAEMQRMMNDPDYAKQMAAKYNNMTEKQKADLVKNQLETKNVDVSNSEFEMQSKQKQNAKNTIDINTFVSKNFSKISEAFKSYHSAIEKLRKTTGNHDELNKSYSELYKKIPLIVMGEGKIPDPEKVKNLNIKYALKHKERASLELSQVQVEYKHLINSVNESTNDYYSFLDKNEYRVNSKMQSIYTGTNTEMSLAQIELNISESISKIAEISYSENSTASRHEQQYQYVLNEK
ncbi:hypothetical protein V8G69_10880 [Gaetbulibacter sp. M235]|uniref:hypothetical protein n=1 Tax=Gaetbulibacter sp. M235 TaxID=3126510 RepID=UPI00374E4D8C